MRIKVLRQREIGDALKALAELRIAIFREFPYLYDGNAAYEAQYLADFASSKEAVLVAAFDGGTVVGAATASPLSEQGTDFKDRVRQAGLQPDELFYFGESVLLPGYRGNGFGHAFFDAREAASRDAGAKGAIFAAVVRPENHPARPADYRSLDAFWSKRGYAPIPGLMTYLDWQEIGEHQQSPKVPRSGRESSRRTAPLCENGSMYRAEQR